MRWLSLLCILFSLNALGKTSLQYAREIEDGIENDTVEMPFLKNYVDRAINGALKRAIGELRKKGAQSFADEIEYEWAMYYGESLFVSNRPIGDHKPISQWLSEKYEQIEAILGIEVCEQLHISDIKSINHGVPVSIHPCSFQMDNVSGDRVDEYVRHIAGGPIGDDKYYGVLPVISWWAAEIGCLASGGAFICGPIAMVTEKVMGVVSPSIGRKIYEKRCGGE